MPVKGRCQCCGKNGVLLEGMTVQHVGCKGVPGDLHLEYWMLCDSCRAYFKQRRDDVENGIDTNGGQHEADA